MSRLGSRARKRNRAARGRRAKPERKHQQEVCLWVWLLLKLSSGGQSTLVLKCLSSLYGLGLGAFGHLVWHPRAPFRFPMAAAFELRTRFQSPSVGPSSAVPLLALRKTNLTWEQSLAPGLLADLLLLN